MTKNEKQLSSITDELNELGLSLMSSTLDTLAHSSEFYQLDFLTILERVIEPEYNSRSQRKLETRIKRAKLQSFTGDLINCKNSVQREYAPSGVNDTLSEMRFVDDGMNVCILGPSDAGKSYLAKALGISACCHGYRVEYQHCENLVEELANLKRVNFEKYQRRMKFYSKLDLLILDDFLLHAISDEAETKVLHDLFEMRSETQKSTITCSQREPNGWAGMILNDTIAANAILKRAAKHYTVVIRLKE